MTETEWLTCSENSEPQTMLEFVRPQTTERKCRLLAVSFCRHILPLVSEPIGHQAVVIAEQYADGLVSLEEMLAVSKQVFDCYSSSPNTAYVMNTEPSLSIKTSSIALQATAFLTGAFDNYLDLCCQCTDLATLRWALLRAKPNEEVPPWRTRIEWQFLLIEDVIGNAFRLIAIEPCWLSRNVIRLAQAIYDERTFERMPILADALKEAGCADSDLLSHCRGPGPHVRGCWAVDLVLGKE